MVYCPPRPTPSSSTDPDPLPADPFFHPDPVQPAPPPLPASGPAALPAEVLARAARPRRARNRLRVILGTGLAAAITLGLAGPSAWQPARPAWHPLPRPARGFDWGPAVPKDVISLARENQKRRRRKAIAIAAAIAAAVAQHAIGSGPPRRPAIHPHHDDGGGGPVPASRAEQLPGLLALDKGQDAIIRGLSCPSAGNCAVDGIYTSSHLERAFVASEADGRWLKAEEVRGLPLRPTGAVTISPVACPSAGNCLAVGNYQGPQQTRGFAVVEHNGTWGRAQQIPGAPVAIQWNASSIALSCASSGNCVFGATYNPGGRNWTQAFIESETNGKWSKAQPVTGLANPMPGDESEITEISCASRGNCTAAGDYNFDAKRGEYGTRAFVVSETGGVWGEAEPISGGPARNTATVA